ncbi:MAG: PQQ-binding-like beta-propeller repeat protein, partial [Planctomycetes bacterium]|nr:PQQ-binding-like beta-propeller repeat protein [Planctomycetota bacterium]
MKKDSVVLEGQDDPDSTAPALDPDTNDPPPVQPVAEIDWWLHRGNAALHGVHNTEIRAPYALVWKKNIDFFALGSPIIVAGNIYVADEEGKVCAFTLKDGKELWRVMLDGGMRAAPTYYDGVLFIGT